MLNLENAVFFHIKKGNSKEPKDDCIYFSITKNKKTGYDSIKFYIGINIAKELKINDKSRLVFGHNRNHKTIWYLAIGNEGYKIRKEKKNDSYSSHIRWPFNFINKKMIKIEKSNIEFNGNGNEQTITIYVFKHVKEEELILK